MKSLSPAAFRARFSEPAEFAVIDPREEGIFTRAHLLAASNLPLSRLELLIERAVPRHDCEIILCGDEGDAVARAAAVLADLGYRNIGQLAGGIAAWAASGGALFSGVNVPGKAFGEYLEKTAGTPALTAQDLKQRLDARAPVLLLDGRTPEEHRTACIPGAFGCPNGDLARQAAFLEEQRETTVVVHCAGRTRSILGAQTLIDAGIANPVYALENGTIWWSLQGYPLEQGSDRELAQPEPAALTEAARRAAAHGRRHGVGRLDLSGLEALRRETHRTTYLIDVRDAPAFRRGSLEGARHLPGGQLVQNIDRALVVRGARTVLLDDDGIRAPMTGAWLRQMGLAEVSAMTLDAGSLTWRNPAKATATLAATPAKRLLEEPGAFVVADIRRSVAYRRGHVPGAWFLTRARIDDDSRKLPAAGPLLLVADDPAYAALVARDLQALGRPVTQLDGGMESWRALGGALERGLTRLASAPDDMHYDSEDLDDPEEIARETRRYLSWEVGLRDLLPGDPAAPYAAGRNSPYHLG